MNWIHWLGAFMVGLLAILLVDMCAYAQYEPEVPNPSMNMIVDVEFTGLRKTKRSYLQHFIKTESGGILDSSRLMRDSQELRNLLYFSHVEYKVRDTLGGKKVVFNFKEKITFLPIFGFNLSEENRNITIGFNDFHCTGRGILARVVYQYYDRHSIQTTLFNPYIGGSKWGGGFEFARYATIEPTYFPEGTVFYDFTLWKAGLLAQYEINLQQRVGVGIHYLFEDYFRNTERNIAAVMEAPDHREFHKMLYQVYYNINRVDVEQLHYLDGFRTNTFVDMATTFGLSGLFYKLVNETMLYKRVRRRGNWAGRFRLGIAENEFSPFPPFVQDSYTNVRGVGNRSTRGTAELTINNEYRHLLASWKWLAVQGVGFVDYSALRLPGSTISNTFNGGAHQELYGGVGLRLHLVNFFGGTLRVDYGFDLLNGRKGEFVVGLGQYF